MTNQSSGADLDIAPPDSGGAIRVLVLSRTGHAKDRGEAIALAVSRSWPGSEVRHACRAQRVGRRLPDVGAGRRWLVGQIDQFDPDLVLPVDAASAAGLRWLREHRGLDVPFAEPDRAGLLAAAEPDATRASVRRLLDERRPAAAGSARSWPMRAADVFFAHVETEDVPQVLGVVLELAPTAAGDVPTLRQVREQMASRPIGLAPLRRRFAVGGRPGWVQERHFDVDVSRHIDERRLGPDEGASAVSAAIDEFWSQPLPAGLPTWQMRLIHSGTDGRSWFVIKMHHCQGDGISELGLLDRLLTVDPDRPLVERQPVPGRPTTVRRRARELRLAARGLVSLAGRGRAPKTPLNGPVSGPGRQLVMVALPARELRRLGRRCQAKGHELVLTLVVDALGRLLRTESTARTSTGEPQSLRVMLPIAMRPARMDRIFGNWTGSVSLDLPLGPMPIRERLALVQQEVHRRVGAGEPQAAHAVMQLAGSLPLSLHKLFARLVYNDRFFNTIVSYMPGARGPRWLAGARVRAMYPVLPLAEGVRLTVGVVIADETASIGVLLDPALGLTDSAVTQALRSAFDELGEQSEPAEASGRSPTTAAEGSV